MTKFLVVGVLFALACGGSALVEDGDIANAASKGDWEGVHQLIKKYIDSRLAAPAPAVPAPLTQPLQTASASELLAKLPTSSGSVPPGGRYFAQSEYSYERKSNNNGKVEEDRGGLGFIDDNGKVTYYKPNPPTNNFAPLGLNNQNQASNYLSPYGG